MATPITEEEFQENLKRFALLEGKKELPVFKEPSRVFLAPNDNGEMNLKIKSAGEEEFLYSKESIKKEAATWFSSLSLDPIKALYVVGIGLGNYYEEIKKWLQASPFRFVIFLEDDKEVLYHFLHSPLAKEILHDVQARVHFMENQDSLVEDLTTVFIFDSYKLTALNYYERKRAPFLDGLSQDFSHRLYTKRAITGEFLSGSGQFYINYYHNMQFLPISYFGNGLFNQFQGIPAIICGAGPSLKKNIELLKSLKDRALIIAGGSAINALTSHNLIPHFTIGLDPNQTQLTRILANYAYEVPFFYRARINTEALAVNSAEKLYLTGAGGYEMPTWIEKKLGIESGPFVDEGYNVINFAVSIAKNLGCNPIIVCGLDLAYTDGHSYIPGLKLHALHNFKNTFITKGLHDELIGFKDIYGNKTTTMWKWINEASWYALFLQANPKVKLINATEGGIGFPNVVHMALADVADQYLNKVYDFEGLVHTEIQNNHFGAKVSDANILKTLKLLRKSLGNCEIFLKDLLEQCSEVLKERQEDKEYDIEPSLKLLAEADKTLRAEDYYKAVLKQFSDHYFWVFEKRMNYFLYDEDKESRDAKIMNRLKLDVGCCRFLKTVMMRNKFILEDAIRNYPKRKPLKRKEKKHLVQKKEADSHLEKEISYYPNKEVKAEKYFENGVMEGPSYYFGKKGNLLAHSVYIKGKREGKASFYYDTGQLFAVKNFKNGLLDGVQEYYYEDGQKQAIIHYSKEILDGAAFFYYPDGKLKRELHFKSGQREGQEKMWDPDGALRIEAFYKEDQPVGVAKWWHSNGTLKQESTYHEDTKNFEIRFFTPYGKETFEEEDYFDKLIKITDSFTKSIENILKQADLIMPHLVDFDSQLMEEKTKDLKILQEKIGELTQLNQKIKHDFSGNAHKIEEPIWKSSALQAKIDEQLTGLIEAMKSEIICIQELIQKAMDKIK